MNKELKRRLRTAVESAWLKRAECGGFRVVDVVSDLQADIELMNATRIAIVSDVLNAAVKRSMKRTASVDPRQTRFPGFEFAPAIITMPGGECIAIEKATHEPLKLFTLAYQARLQEKIKGSKLKKPPDFSHESKTLKVLQQVDRMMARYSGKEPDITVEESFRRREIRKLELQTERRVRKTHGRT